MSISGVDSNTTIQSISAMGDLLKTIADTNTDLEKKMINLTVTEQVSNQSLGQLIDSLR